MARGGINLALVRKAREALVARGQNPSMNRPGFRRHLFALN